MDRGGRITRNVFRSTVANYLGQAVTLVVGFFLTPFILRHITATDFGLWALAGSLVGYGSLLDFGIAEAVIKFVASYRAQGEIARARGLVATALSLYTALGLAAVALSAALAPIFPVLFSIAPGQRTSASWVIFVMGCNIGLSIPAAISFAVLAGLQRFDLANVIGVVSALASAVGTVWVLLSGRGLLGMVTTTLVVTAAMQIPAIWIVRHVEPGLRIGWRGTSRTFLPTLVSFSLPIFAIYIAGRLQTETDEIVIGRLLSVSKITPYSIAQRLSEIGLRLTYQFMKVVLPLASELQAEDDRRRLRALYITSSRLTAAIFVPIGCMLIVLSHQILTVWVGSRYSAFAPLVVLLTIASFLDTILWPAGSTLRAVERHHILGWVALTSGLANLVLSVILIRHFGLTGVALGTLIPTAAESLCIVLPYTCRTLDVHVRQMFGDVLLPAFLPAVPMVAVLYLAATTLAISSLASLIGVCSVALLVYVSGYFWVGAGDFESGIPRQIIHDVRRHLPISRKVS